MEKKAPLFLLIAILAFSWMSPVTAMESSKLASVALEEIRATSQYDIRELVRRMSVEQVNQLDQAKKTLVLQKLGMESNSDIQQFKDKAALVGEGKVKGLLVSFEPPFDFNAVFDRLPYGSYELIEIGNMSSYYYFRSLESNIILIEQFDSIIEILSGETIAEAPKHIEGPVISATFLKENADEEPRLKEENYQKALELFTKGIEYIFIKVQLVDRAGSEDEERARMRLITQNAVPENTIFDGTPFLLSTVPPIFRYAATREILNALNADSEVENILPVKWKLK